MSKDFYPIDYQGLMIGHGIAHPRCNILASPGMGKTASTLAILDSLSLAADVFPALVLGPLRVANSVWDREIEKWSQFNGLRIAKILGTEQERLAALRTPADIYTTHYGLLKWLTETLAGKWPYKTVVADESTRLKSQRCSFQKHPKSGKTFLRRDGSVNAAALARYALRTERWINLTGTFSPNGLQDIWGQHWFVDFGQSLGNSYEAFSRRWFYQRRGTDKEQAIFDPMPHAQEEITRRIAPTTISVNAYDYFDCEKPREVDIEIELPEHLMKSYRKLHREAVLKLNEETTITAVNAGAITNKCLQYASGHVFDKDKTAHWIHDEKLNALESLHENLGGAPLLVAYHFKPDRDRILRKFKYAELLPSGAKQKEVEDRWNEGRIPMLIGHPASVGHGLNLQYGGCDLCVYTPYWDLELYQQIIERIGPVRQMQAGFDRLVSVYRLITQRTFDPAVAERLKTKAGVQDAVMAAVNV